MAFVTLKDPFALKELVESATQFVSEAVKFVVVNTRNVPLDVPFVPLKTKLPADTATQLMRGTATTFNTPMVN